MTQAISVRSANVLTPSETAPVRPFRVNLPDAALKDLRRRIAATRWPDKEAVSDQAQGVQLAITPGGLTRGDVVDNITVFWLTNTAISSARLYWENKFSYFSAKRVAIPVAVSVLPDELYRAPRSSAERAYPKLVHHKAPAEGGHFAAREQPRLFVQELRAGFRSLRP